jgi:hypothetical protein
MKRFWWLIILLLVLVGIPFFYLKKEQIFQKIEAGQFLYYQETQKWEKYDGEDVIGEDRKSIIEIIAKSASQLLLSL